MPKKNLKNSNSMPTVPFNSPYVSQFGFRFDFVDAFNETAGAPGNTVSTLQTSLSTTQTSLGASNDVYPTQPTAWGRANQAYTLAGSTGNVPPANFFGETIFWNGAAWAPSANSLRLGKFAGESTQNLYATALGLETGRYNQGSLATAIGFKAGETNQGTKAIAIGDESGQVNQGVNAIAIGTLAGASNQHDNTIILNASGAAINSLQTGAMYVNPIRNVNGNSTIMTYNAFSGEVCFDTQLPLSLGTSNDTPSLTSSVWAYAKQTEANVQSISNAFSYNIYVSDGSGSDTTGTGTIGNPYKTIGKAVLVANAISEANPVTICLAAGTYTENVSITRANTFINGSSARLSTATVIDGSLTVDMTASTVPYIIGGVSSVQIDNIIFNNSVGNTQSYLVTDCFLVPGFGVSAVAATDTSVGGNGDITLQSCLIYMSDAIAITSSNVYVAIFACEIKNYAALIYPNSFIQTTGTGRIIMLNSVLTQASTDANVAPIINLANTSATQFMTFSGNTIQYSSSASDAGNGNKCCIRLSNSAAISAVTVLNNTLICQGATTTNGTPGQILAIQRTGAGTVTINYGQNICGPTANHLPAAAVGLTKIPFVVLR